ncbi:MAG: carboxylating nicotinate-nucleotide diphosphorylase [Bacteriovoracaceae bacterium]|nr:carboxylating nicotinate-nucleotide diphosphorylase [Bacteriovoracaceae bacterium]
MDTTFWGRSLQKDLEHYFLEDDLSRNFYYIAKLPTDQVVCSLKFKSDLLIAGLPYFAQCFKYLGADKLDLAHFMKFESRTVTKESKFAINFELPFNIAVTGERIALNLLQRASSIATFTNQFVEKAKKYNIAILDTRKTTPGLRALEKYAVQIGGGHNHRLGQTDVWMVKDNHKNYFGGLTGAVDFFRSMHGFYTPIEVEIHNLDELKQALDLKVTHVMLDNFTPDEIAKAINIKPDFMSYEVSGGITIDNIDQYLVSGIDAISIGALTYAAPSVDVSLKYKKDR